MDLLPATKSILTEDQKLRVFVSSTLGELNPERSAVINAIFELKLYPVYFESGARPYPPREVYSSAVNQSHIFIGIYWESYGWLAPGEKISGIEDEFQLAESKFKLIYIKNSNRERDPQLRELIRKIEASQAISYTKFDNAEELAEIVKDDIMLLLSERFDMDSSIKEGVFIGPSFTELLNQEINKKKIINRSHVVNGIKNLMMTHQKVMITGDPGIGKTYVLGQIARETHSLYISIKNKTVYQICSNLANHLTVRRNLAPKNLFTEEDAKAALQEELANTSIILILDDIDWNIETYRSLMGLEYYDCCLILACRALVSVQDAQLYLYEIPAFSREEIISFLEINEKVLSPGELQRLVDSSGGNPLYLYYFVSYEVFPLPEGLASYHRLLWDQLQPLQKEILNLIALSHASLGVSDFHVLLNKNHLVSETLMDTEAIVDSIKPLSRIINKKIEIFHPYFEEFILGNATSLGVDDDYNLLLAEYALEKQWIVPSAIHLIKAQDTRADELVMQAISITFLSGDWKTCENLLKYQLSTLERETNEESEAKVRTFLAQVLYEIGHYDNSRIQLDKAKNLMEKVGDVQSLHEIEMWENLLFIQDGQIDRAIEGFKKGITEVAEKDDQQEAIMQINLSYAYIQKSDFENGSVAAERALKLFTELSDDRGKHSAIVNLSSCCVGGLGNLDLQKKYALDIIKIANEENNLRLKAAGLNHIAVVHRRSDEFDEAEEALVEAIQISQQIGSFELEALNIANLGNVYLDRREYKQAEDAYVESLNISKLHHLDSQIGRALELLSRLKYRIEEYKASQRLAEDALVLHKRFGDPIRLATTLSHLGDANEKLGNEREAGENFEKAGDFYQDAKEWQDAAKLYRQAMGIWNKLGEIKNLQYCLQQGLNCALRENAPEIAKDILADASQVENVEDLDVLYERIFNVYLGLENKKGFSIFMQDFCSFCERYCNKNNVLMFKRAVHRMVDTLSEAAPSQLVNALAVTMTQASPRLIGLDELDSFANEVAGKLQGLYFRNLDEGRRIWTVGTKWSNGMIFQIETLSEEDIVARASMALALFLFSNNEFIETDLKSFGTILENGISIKVVTQNDFEAGTGMKISETDENKHKDSQATLATATKFDEKLTPVITILHNNFEIKANCAINPGNKVYVWLLMIIYSAIVAHSLHEQQDAVPELASKSRQFCEKIFLASKSD